MMYRARSKIQSIKAEQSTAQAAFLAKEARFLAELEMAVAEGGTPMNSGDFSVASGALDALCYVDLEASKGAGRPVCSSTIRAHTDDRPSLVTSTSTTPRPTDDAVIALVRSWIKAFFVSHPGARPRRASSTYKSEVLPATWDMSDMCDKRAKRRAKFFYSTRAAERHVGFFWTLNLGDVVHRNALKSASSGTVARNLSDRINRQLKKAGFSDPKISFVIDVDVPDDKHPCGKLHLHGIAILENDDLDRFAKAMRAAGGKMKSGHSTQFFFRKDNGEPRRVSTADWLSRYCLKEGGRPTLSCSPTADRLHSRFSGPHLYLPAYEKSRP